MGCSGIIIRNQKGEILSGLTYKFPAPSCLTAEVVALRDAVNLAHSLNLEKVVFECDNLELVKSWRGEDLSREIQLIVQDIKSYGRHFNHVGFTWTPREGNKVAHNLALLASRDLLPLDWHWNLPSPVQAAISVDCSFCCS